MITPPPSPNQRERGRASGEEAPGSVGNSEPRDPLERAESPDRPDQCPIGVTPKEVFQYTSDNIWRLDSTFNRMRRVYRELDETVTRSENRITNRMRRVEHSVSSAQREMMALRREVNQAAALAKEASSKAAKVRREQLWSSKRRRSDSLDGSFNETHTLE